MFVAAPAKETPACHARWSGHPGNTGGTRSAATAHPGSPSLAPEPALGRAFGPTRGALAGDDRVRERHRSASGHAPPLPRPRHRAGRVMCPSRGHAASPLLPTLQFVSGPLRDEGWRALKRRHASLVLWGASPAPAATISGLRHPRSTGERNGQPCELPPPDHPSRAGFRLASSGLARPAYGQPCDSRSYCRRASFAEASRRHGLRNPCRQAPHLAPPTGRHR